MITRLRLDAALYDAAPQRVAQTPRTASAQGQATAVSLAQRTTDVATVWQRLTVRWYGGTPRALDMATATAVWYHTGMVPVTLRWVLTRDPEAQFAPQARWRTWQTPSVSNGGYNSRI